MHFKRERVFGVVFAVAAALAGCGQGDDAAPADRQENPPEAGSPTDCSEGTEDGALTYENFGAPFMLSYCTGCHSAALSGQEARRNAPAAINFDSLAGIRQHLERIEQRATGVAPTMPPAGGPSAFDRARLEQWIACGAPGGEDPTSFMGLVREGLPMTPPYDPTTLSGRACAEPVTALPTEALPRCARATYACALDCEANAEDEDACKNACYAADTLNIGNEPCEECVTRQGLACANQTKCRDAVAAALCCLYNECTSADCTQTTCARQFRGLIYCIAYEAPHCFDLRQNPDVMACFEE